MRRGLIFMAAVLVAGATAGEAAAGPASCGSSGRPWVGIGGSAPELPALTDLLRAELRSRGIDLCAGAEQHDEPPIATVDVSLSEQGAQIVVEVRDRLTAKRVDREVDLAAVPADGRPLTLAVAAGELLRASWAELALASAPPASAPVPPAVEESLGQDLVRPSRSQPTVGFGAAGVIEHWAGGATLYGPDLRVAARLASHLSVALRLGLRDGVTANAPDGEVHPTAWVAGAGATIQVTPWQRVGIDGVGRFDVERVSYVAVPNPRARGSADAGFAVIAGAGVDGWLDLGASVRVMLEGVATVPVRALRPQDAGQDVSSVSGIGFAGGVGVGVVL
jgi:hypothetical protein